VYEKYPSLLAEMYAYSMAAAHVDLPHFTMESLMVSNVHAGDEGWKWIDMLEDNVCEPPVDGVFYPGMLVRHCGGMCLVCAYIDAILLDSVVPMSSHLHTCAAPSQRRWCDRSQVSVVVSYVPLSLFTSTLRSDHRLSLTNSTAVCSGKVLPDVLHFCQFYRAGEFGFQKRRIKKQMFECGHEMMAELPRDLGKINYKNRDGEVRSNWVVCNGFRPSVRCVLLVFIVSAQLGVHFALNRNCSTYSQSACSDVVVICVERCLWSCFLRM
jgi:hypothetical protein